MIARNGPRVGTGDRNGTQSVDQVKDIALLRPWPRPVREVRAELEALSVQAYEAGTGVDANQLDRLAYELVWCAAVARAYGGDATATEEFARAIERTAELARLTRTHREAVAA